MWNNITIKKFKDIVALNNDKVEYDIYEKEIKLLCIVNDKVELYYEELDFKLFQEELKKIKFLSEEIKINTKIYNFIKIKDRTFKVLTNLNKMSTANYQNLCLLNKSVDDYNKNIPTIISLFLEEYKVYDFKLFKIRKKLKEQPDLLELSDFIENNMSIVDAQSIATFFLIISEKLIKIMKYSLILKMKKMWKKEKNKDLKKQISDSIQHIIIES